MNTRDHILEDVGQNCTRRRRRRKKSRYERLRGIRSAVRCAIGLTIRAYYPQESLE